MSVNKILQVLKYKNNILIKYNKHMPTVISPIFNTLDDLIMYFNYINIIAVKCNSIRLSENNDNLVMFNLNITNNKQFVDIFNKHSDINTISQIASTKTSPTTGRCS